MSDIEAKITAVLDKFDEDIERVTDRLDPILQSNSIDELSEAEPDAKKTAVPYALSAYALSSMLFAYLRSEGKDTAIVMPELARVKERLERLSAPPSHQNSEPPSDSDKSKASPRERTPGKSTGKHLRFDNANQPKKSKRGKSHSR